MNSRELSVLAPAAKEEPETCEGCGAEFTCGATLAGCWCCEIQLSEEVRARLRERYERCLCRACLEKEAAKSGPQKPASV